MARYLNCLAKYLIELMSQFKVGMRKSVTVSDVTIGVWQTEVGTLHFLVGCAPRRKYKRHLHTRYQEPVPGKVDSSAEQVKLNFKMCFESSLEVTR